MKNIKKVLLQVWQGYMWFSTFSFTTLLLVIFILFLEINALSIDSCLDRGGAWHYVAEQCFYTDEEKEELIEKFGPVRPKN